MINEGEVRSKTDDDLLNIWANQLDYIPEMIPWVKSEIERRHLDTSSIHVRTMAEVGDEEERESDRTFVRMVSMMQGLTGSVLLLFTIFAIIDHLREYFRDQTEELSIDLPLVMLILGLLLIVYAIGVWKERKWALLSGLILYSIITILNIVATTINGLMFFADNNIKVTAMPFVFSIGSTFVSVCLVLAFNRLRKRRGFGVRTPVK